MIDSFKVMLQGKNKFHCETSGLVNKNKTTLRTRLPEEEI